MNQHLNTIEIRKYLSGEMPPEEENELERHLNECPLCADAVEGYQEMPNQSELLQNAESMMPNIDSRKDKSRVIRPWFYAIAAALIGVGMFAGIHHWMGIGGAGDVFASEFRPYTNDITMRFRGQNDSTNAPLDADLMGAMEAYDSKNYQVAVGRFNSFLIKDPGNTTAFFFLGNSLLSLGQGEEAFRYFKSVEEDVTSPYYTSATWYLGLCCLQMEDITAAKTYFREVVNGNGFYKKGAQEMLDKL